jgi:hypothetical protein
MIDQEKEKNDIIGKNTKPSMLNKNIEIDDLSELYPNLEWLYSLRVVDILVGHRNLDSTKWSTGMSIAEWLEFDGIEPDKGAARMEKIIIKKSKSLTENPILIEGINMSWVYYYYPEIMPHYHQFKSVKTAFVVEHKEISKKYKVEISLFPFLLRNQDGNGQYSPIWHKGGITIYWKEENFVKKRWQVMKWTGCE